MNYICLLGWSAKGRNDCEFEHTGASEATTKWWTESCGSIDSIPKKGKQNFVWNVLKDELYNNARNSTSENSKNLVSFVSFMICEVTGVVIHAILAHRWAEVWQWPSIMFMQTIDMDKGAYIQLTLLEFINAMVACLSSFPNISFKSALMIMCGSGFLYSQATSADCLHQASVYFHHDVVE